MTSKVGSRKISYMGNKIHHLGSGWEPHVDEINSKLIYSIPVGSSFVSLDFKFEIKPVDLEVLKSNLYRYSLLYISLHTLLQNMFGPSSVSSGLPPKFTQEEFDQVVKVVLHSSDDDVKIFISNFDKDHNISLIRFVDDFQLKKMKPS